MQSYNGARNDHGRLFLGRITEKQEQFNNHITGEPLVGSLFFIELRAHGQAIQLLPGQPGGWR